MMRWRLMTTSGTVARALSPLRYLVKPEAVLDSWPMDCDYELRHRPNLCGNLVGSEFGNRERYSFVKGFRLNFNIMRDAVGIGKRDPAPVHGAIIYVRRLFAN
jgi:hypothetical protein